MREQIQYEGPKYALSSFPVVFHGDEISEARPSVYANWHSGLELLRCKKGCATVIADRAQAVFGEGDIAVIPSNALHSLFWAGQSCDYDCLIVEPSFLKSVGLPVDKTLDMVIRDGRALELFNAVKHEIENPCELYMPAALGKICLLFTHLYRNFSGGGREIGIMPAEDRYSNLINALEYIRSHLSSSISVDELAACAGISKYYFCHMFKLYTGMSPIVYINTLRCEQAGKLILSGASVSEAALSVGIDNLSYFTRLYKKTCGRLPSGERRSKNQ